MTKDLNSAAYWDRFGANQLDAADRPSPREAADTVLGLMQRVAVLERALLEAQQAHQRDLRDCNRVMMDFAGEVEQLA